VLLPAQSRAAPLDTQQAIDLITSTADKICNVVSTKGEAQSSEVKGDVKVQLKGLASKLVDAGVSGAGSITNDDYQNVLRQDLAQTLHDNAGCKLKVFDTLQNKLLASNATPPPPVQPPYIQSSFFPVNTGSVSIDAVDAKLNNLQPGYSEGALAKALESLFSRPLFVNVGEADDLGEALYVFCRAQIILERYADDFSLADVHQAITQATQNLIYLQDQLGRAYGPNFKRADMCRTHSITLGAYEQSLPAIGSEAGEQAHVANKILPLLRSSLNRAGVLHSP
jgi:hypothetical protein